MLHIYSCCGFALKSQSLFPFLQFRTRTCLHHGKSDICTCNTFNSVYFCIFSAMHAPECLCYLFSSQFFDSSSVSYTQKRRKIEEMKRNTRLSVVGIHFIGVLYEPCLIVEPKRSIEQSFLQSRNHLFW